MGSVSKIEWTDATWTPIRASAIVFDDYGEPFERVGWHCEHVSEGCRNCYAESINKRLGTSLDYKPGHRKDIKIFLDEKMLLAPLGWKKPRMVFVCSMTDLFAEFVDDEWIDRMFAVMALCPQHTFQVLTKRAKRIREYSQSIRDGLDIGLARAWANHRPMPGQSWQWPLPNVWFGVSVEDQPSADERIPDLMATLAAVRFVSYEPALGPVDFTHVKAGIFSPLAPDHRIDVLRRGFWHKTLDWVICGGESGPHARPMEVAWAEFVRDQCRVAGVKFFMKQMAKKAPIPDELFIREIPCAT